MSAVPNSRRKNIKQDVRRKIFRIMPAGLDKGIYFVKNDLAYFHSRQLHAMNVKSMPNRLSERDQSDELLHSVRRDDAGQSEC